MAALSVGTSVAANTNIAAAKFRKSVLIQNVHASQVLYADTDPAVTTSTGIKITAGESLRIATRDVVYLIASGASTDVRYLNEF